MESALRERGRDPALKLIETLGWDGLCLVRGDRHLARLERSAARLGWVCDTAAARAALVTGRSGPARLRLTLDALGRFEVTEGSITVTRAPWRLRLADDRLDASDPWLGIKSTHRLLYDATRSELADGVDEVIFANVGGEICEGTITNLFFDAGAGLCTPPLTCGLLPGVLREEMLATGQVREAVLVLADLPVARLWVGNSLRGLIPAVLIP